MHILDELDEPKASLRMLLLLSVNLQGMNVVMLYRAMKEAHNVGRPAVDTTYKALVRAGLAEAYEMTDSGSGSKLKVIALTPLGIEVASKIVEIERVIGDAKKSPGKGMN
jgi:DNA-binding PadR family transcriptional regulator